MHAARRTLALACCLAAFVVIGGGHWAALQTVAWVKMAVDYTHDTGSVRDGLVRTFDGAHPCELCRQISAGIQRESGEEKRGSSHGDFYGKAKLTAVLPGVPFVPSGRRGGPPSAPVVPGTGRTVDSPPTPPPRAA